MKKVLLLMLLSFMFVAGCKDDDPEIKAPSFIKPHLYHLYRTVPDCFKANNIANEKYDCNVTVKTTPATGEYKGHPTYQYDGKTVGGVTFGRCKSSSTIVMPVFGERYSKEVLQHELCHAYDFCKLCGGGHPAEYAPCCPSWPYLRSLTDTNDIIIVNCVDAEIDVGTGTNILVSITTLGGTNTNVGIQAVDDSWIINLIQELDPEFDF